MNYIKKLEATVANQKAALEEAREEIDAFTAFLHTDKFTGTEFDGREYHRKDWISTSDLLSRLSDIRGKLSVEVV